MSEKRKFIRNGLLLSAVGVGARAVGLVFGAYVTRSVGEAGMGLYTLIMTLFGFAFTFASAGISLTVTRLVAAARVKGESAKERAAVRGGVRYALLFGGAASVVLFAFAPAFGSAVLKDERSVASIRVLALSLVPGALCSVFSGYFVGIRRVADNAAVSVGVQAFKIALTVLLLPRAAARGVADACLLLSAVSAATDFVCVLLLGVFYRLRRPKERCGRVAFGEVFSLTVPLAVSAVVRSALLTVEHVLIPRRLCAGGAGREEALSSYGMLHGMALPLLLFPMAPLSSFCGLLVPEFAAMSHAGQKKRMEHTASLAAEYAVAYAVCTCVLLLYFSDGIGTVLYRSEGVGSYIRILAPVLPIMYLDHLTDSILKGIGESVYSMWVNIADAALSVCLVWILLAPYGIAGYAALIVLMELFNFVLSYLRLRRYMRFRIRLVPALVCPLVGATLAAWLTRCLFPTAGAPALTLWLPMAFFLAVAGGSQFLFRLLLRRTSFGEQNLPAVP